MQVKRDVALNALACCIVALYVFAVYTMQISSQEEVSGVPVQLAKGQGVHPLLTQYRARREDLMQQGHAKSLVCIPMPEMGFGNKIMHLVSCVALCVVTDRVLYFDWPERHASGWTYVWKMITQGEDTYSQSSYSSLFRAFFVHPQRLDAGLEPQSEQNTLTFPFPSDDGGVVYAKSYGVLRRGNFSEAMPSNTLYVQGWNFWGKAVFENVLYGDTPLAKMGAEAFFTFTTRALLQPVDDYKAQDDCGWLIHYRVNRYYNVYSNRVASLPSFQECAASHGFKVEQGGLNLLMSDGDASVPGFTSLARGCRTGYQCDIEAVHQLHRASKCRQAVLTYESSFGQIAASMGNITDAWEVKLDGSCQKRNSTLPNVMY